MHARKPRPRRSPRRSPTRPANACSSLFPFPTPPPCLSRTHTSTTTPPPFPHPYCISTPLIRHPSPSYRGLLVLVLPPPLPRNHVFACDRGCDRGHGFAGGLGIGRSRAVGVELRPRHSRVLCRRDGCARVRARVAVYAWGSGLVSDGCPRKRAERRGAVRGAARPAVHQLGAE